MILYNGLFGKTKNEAKGLEYLKKAAFSNSLSGLYCYAKYSKEGKYTEKVDMEKIQKKKLIENGFIFYIDEEKIFFDNDNPKSNASIEFDRGDYQKGLQI